MAEYFLDSSALVKRYTVELGSGWIMGITTPIAANSCWIAGITRVEIVSALFQKVRNGHIRLDEAQRAEIAFRSELVTHFQLLAITPAVLDQAMNLVSIHPLRAYDSVQLAAALFLKSQTTASGLPQPLFISADQILNQAALAEGFSVDDPNMHL